MKKQKLINIISVIIILALILSFKTISMADENTTINRPTLELKADVTEIKKGEKIPIQLIATEGDKNVEGIDLFVHCNTDIFDDLTIDDIKPTMATDQFDYNVDEEYSQDGNLILVTSSNKGISNGVLATIYLTPKVDVPANGQKVELLKLYDGAITYEDGYTEHLEDKNISGWPTKEELDKLYLNTDVYKIGTDNTNKYEEDDRFISQVEPQTTLKTFISNLTTNGTTIKVLKPDGTELEDADDQYVGTGMTLLITKDEDTKMPQKIKLQISVKGDIARSAKEGEEDGANLKWGDGQVTMIDLTRANLAFLDMLDLEDEFKISADINESNRISIIDIVNINLMFLGLQQ